MQTKEEIAAYHKQYYQDNKENKTAYAKQYREDNKEKSRAYHKQYYQDNKENKTAYNKQYNEDNKKEKTAYNKQYNEDNKKEVVNKRYKRNLEIFEYKGGECAHCKIREPDQLEIYDYHHVDPSTKLHPVCRIMQGPIERLIAEVDKCLLLCSNCHRKEHARLHKEKQDEII